VTERAGSRRRFRKKVLCRHDGELFDLTLRRPISLDELREYVRDGGLFEARTRESGRDCTLEVLQRIVGDGLLANMVPGLSGNPLAALAGGGRMEAFNGLMRLLGPNAPGPSGWDRESWEGPARERRRPPEPLGWDEDTPTDDDWDRP
jgi:hypothetical protein